MRTKIAKLAKCILFLFESEIKQINKNKNCDLDNQY